MTTATYATRNGTNTLDTIYYDHEGGSIIEERSGGSISWDDFNPGNILYVTSGPGSAGNLGAIGEYIGSNGFDYDIFPSYAVGFAALESLLESSIYEGAGFTILQAINYGAGLDKGRDQKLAQRLSIR